MARPGSCQRSKAPISGLSDVQVAYDAGIKQLQLIHFMGNPFGDFRTSPPQHMGLTEVGNEVIAERNRHGVLIEPKQRRNSRRSACRIQDAYDDRTRPASEPRDVGGSATSVEHARAIANTGGALGLWALSSDVGRTLEGYSVGLPSETQPNSRS